MLGGRKPTRTHSPWLLRFAAAQALGYVASTQAVFMVGCHFGWLFLVAIGLTNGESSALAYQPVQWFLQAYRALGGVDETGRGGPAEMMEVWGTLSLIPYGLRLLLEGVWGSRPPTPLKKKVALSTAIAAGGYGLAFALISPSMGRPDEPLLFYFGFVGATAVFSVWALLWSTAVDHVVALMEPPVSASAPAWIRFQGRLLSLAMAGVLLALGMSGILEEVHLLSSVGSRGQGAARHAGCTSAEVCEQRCTDGHAAACGLLSEVLEYGLMGMPPDIPRARALGARACELGDSTSCTRLAATLERGAPTPEQLQEAERLHRRACELGSAEGCAGVGYLYTGVQNGPPRDEAIAAQFFSKACQLGNQEVCARAGLTSAH